MRPVSRISSVVKSTSALVFTDQIIFSAGSFLATFLSARLLKAADFGWYSGVILILYLLVSLSASLTIYPYQVSSSRFLKSPAYDNFVFYFHLIIAVAFGAITCSIIGTLFKSYASFKFHLALLTVSFLVYDFSRKMLLAKSRMVASIAIDSAVTVLMTGTLVWFLLLNGKMELPFMLGLTSLVYFIGGVLGWVALRPGIQGTRAWKYYLIKHFSQGKWLIMSAGVQWWAGNLFVVASGIFLGSATLGAFRIVQSLFGVFNMVLQTYENYVLPQAVQRFKISVNDSKKYLRMISLYGACASGVVSVLLFAFSEQLMWLIGGSQYTSYGYAIKGMSILYFVIFVGYPIRIAVRMLVMNNIFFAGYLISFLFSLLSFRFLLSELGLVGAIIGLTANQIILLVFWQYRLAQKKYIIWK